MEVEEIKKQLDRELKETGWVYKYWKKEDDFEFRNTGKTLSKEEADDRIEKFIDDLEDTSFKSTLTGKLCIQKTDEGTFIKKHVGDDGQPSGEGEEMTEEEVKEFLRESMRRIDCDLLPRNIAVVDRSEIIDIYSEKVRELKMVTVNMKGKKMITLRDDGGLQFESG